MKTTSRNEQPQTSSGHQATIGLLLIMSLSSLVGFLLIYLLYLGGNLKWFPGIPGSSSAVEMFGNAIRGSSGLLMVYTPLFTAIIVGFVIMTRLPPILGNEAKRKDLLKVLWHGVIPFGTVMFFALLVFQFLGGRFMDQGSMASGMTMFILVFVGVIATGFILKSFLKAQV